MDHFDKYIRRQTESDLDLPSELAWDNMNIPLPNKKKKKRRFFWLFLVGIAVVLGFGANYLLTSELNVEQTVTKSSSIHTYENENLQKNKPTVTPNSNSITALQSYKTAEASKEEIVTQNLRSKIGQTSTNNNNNNNNKTITSTTFSNNIGYTNLTEKKTRLASNITQSVRNDKEKESLNDGGQTITPPSNKVLENETPKQYLDQVNAIRSIGLSSLAYHSNLDLPLLDKLKIEKDASHNSISFFTGYGYSFTNIQYDDGPQASVLNQAVSPAYGFSTFIGLRFPIRKSSFFSSEVTYQNLKSHFMYTENLGTKLDQANFQKITTLRHVCHTNSIESLGIRLGIGQKFMLSSKLGIELTGALSSNYQITGNGRTLDDNSSIISVDDHQFPDKFQFNAHFNTGVFLEMKKIKIVGILGWQRSLNKTLLLENSSINQSSKSLNFGIGIEKKI